METCLVFFPFNKEVNLIGQANLCYNTGSLEYDIVVWSGLPIIIVRPILECKLWIHWQYIQILKVVIWQPFQGAFELVRLWSTV